MADSGAGVRDEYDVNREGSFRTYSDFERAKSNGDVDSNGYDRNGNHYNSYGDRDYDSGLDVFDSADYDGGK